MNENRPITNGLPEEEDEHLYEHHRFTVDSRQQPLRIDKWLFNRLEKTSRNRIQQAIRAGNILVNDSPVKPNYKVKAGDRITVVLPHPPSGSEIIPENIPLEIIYEDEDVIVLNKPAGIVVHPGVGNYRGTLVNALAWHFGQLPALESEMPRPGLVHRLDKGTSGVMVVAKTEYAMNHLARQFFERTISRKYIALVWGNFDQKEGTIICNVGRNRITRFNMQAFPEGDGGKHAVTHYRVLEDLYYVSLIECRLETGRTHQIRVHMQFAGHPVFADPDYGGNRIAKGTIFSKYKQFVTNCFKLINRQALHARSLEFTHPVTGKRLHFESPLPDDISMVIEKWRNYVSHLNK